MKEFIISALSIVLIGICSAIIFAKYKKEVNVKLQYESEMD